MGIILEFFLIDDCISGVGVRELGLKDLETVSLMIQVVEIFQPPDSYRISCFPIASMSHDDVPSLDVLNGRSALHLPTPR